MPHGDLLGAEWLMCVGDVFQTFESFQARKRFVGQLLFARTTSEPWNGKNPNRVVASHLR